jgi:uncharacterized membrane protein
MKTKAVAYDQLFVSIILLGCIVLFFLPTGFENQPDEGYVQTKAKIISSDNSDIMQNGIIKIGVQVLQIEILDGIFQGQRLEATNQLIGKLEMDKMFQPEDTALVILHTNNGAILAANVLDHYRLHIEFILFLLFMAVLVWYAGWIGAKAILSFVFTILIMWKVLFPCFLKGWDPIIISLFVVALITSVVIFLVAGLTKKAVVACLGALAGVVATCLLALIFGYGFKVHGAVMPFAETLLHNGYGNLDLTKMFLAGIFIASSGAMMDISTEIAAAIAEVIEKKPDITRKEAIGSGLTIGRTVIGTMTTTLLLAYSGGYTALMMVFMAQGTPNINILNITYVAAEIMHTLVGSFGVVLVAPLTAVLGGIIMVDSRK